MTQLVSMQIYVLVVIAIAVWTFGFAIGVAVFDKISSGYWESQVNKIKTRYESKILSAEIEGFNRGVSASEARVVLSPAVVEEEGS